MTTAEALAILTVHLATVRAEQRYPLDDGGSPIGPAGFDTESSPAAEIAREWADALLEAADANGLSGCRLCQS